MATKEETDKFIGCILSVKTKPGRFGDVQNIVGTVKDIHVGKDDEQSIILDDAMSNGLILPDGYRLKSSQIADLTVIGKVDDIEEASISFRNDPSPPALPKQPLTLPKTHHGINQNLRVVHNNLSSSSSDSEDSSSEDNLSLKVSNVAKAQGTSQSQVPGGNVLLNSLSSAQDSYNTVQNITHKNHTTKEPHKIAKPKPRKPQPGQLPIYSAPPVSSAGSRIIAQGQAVALESLFPSKPTTTSIKNVDLPKENILTQTFGSMLISSTGMMSSVNVTTSGTNLPLNGASLFNTLSSATAAAKDGGGKIIVNEFKTEANVNSKLGVLSKFVMKTGTDVKSTKNGIVENVECNLETQNGKQNRNFNQFEVNRSPRGKTISYANKGGRGQTGQGQGDAASTGSETFTMSKTEMSKEFDFEGSNAHFQKLPVEAKKPVLKKSSAKKDPHFTSEDTTLLAERMVESVTLRGTGVVPSKRFVTDTGILIPAVDLSTRSRILNLAHDVGLDHSRMIETMARAVVQTCLPIFGDAYRLSPEREEDRPWILICAGPHWQGAVGTAAARIMASLGVRTVVHSPKEELSVCAKEEKLYGLTGEVFTRRLSDLGNRRFELVIMAIDDHLSPQLTLQPYARWLANTSVVFVDPPLISSYREPLELACGKSNSGARFVVITPALPLAYGNEPTVKLYLVNLGIPQGIYLKNDVLYKSPFGDKLVVQIFSSKQPKPAASETTVSN